MTVYLNDDLTYWLHEAGPYLERPLSGWPRYESLDFLEGLLQYAQYMATGYCPKPVHSTQRLHSLFLENLGFTSTYAYILLHAPA